MEPVLLTVVRELQQGEASPEELVEVLETTRSELEGQRAGFEAALKRESGAVQELVRAEVGAVHQSLDDYFAVLDSCGAYLQGFEAAYLDSTVEALPLAASRLDFDFLRFREAVFSQRGPTTHPGINQLLAAADSGTEVEGLVEFENLRVQMALEHLRQAPPHALTALLIRFHEDYGKALARPQDGAWFEALESLGERYSRVDAESVSRRFLQQPTPIPALNLALNTAWLLTQRKVEPELAYYFLDLFQQQLANGEGEIAALQVWCESLAAWIEHPSDATLKPLVDEALEAAEAYRKAEEKASKTSD